MGESYSSQLKAGAGPLVWPMALLGIIGLRAALALATKSPSFIVSSNVIIYFLLLLLATALAAGNAVQNRLGSRAFWIFLAISCGLWGLDQWLYLYYGFFLNADVPDNSIADLVLFLHVVPLMAAVATLPHRSRTGRRLYPMILNFLYLLFFWSFLYGYAVLPFQFLFPNAAGYALRFDFLYLLENLALVLALVPLALRAEAPWRSIYRNLLGACTLYTLSSTVANLAIDSGGYVSGKLYGLGLTASVCWFLWVPLRARQFPEAKLAASPSDGIQDSQASLWAMLAVIVISIPVVRQLFHGNQHPSIQIVRLLVALTTLVALASAAFFREYFAKRELAAHVSQAHDRLRLAMESGKSVGLDRDVRSGRDVWFGDLKSVFGIPADNYVGRAEDFLGRVLPEDRERVAKTLYEAMRGHQPYAAECRILQPDGTVRWIGTQGRFYYAANGEAERMLGIAVDISQRKQAEQALQDSTAALARVTRIAAMGELTASIAHEVNQPLAAVAADAAAALHWLAVQPPNLNEAREAVGRTIEETNRASGVIARIRSLLRKAQPELRPLNANEVIRETLLLADRELLADQVNVKTELAVDVPIVLGDHIQLQQVLLNLILNAIEAMKRSGGRRQLCIKSGKHDGGTLIQVRDTGTGIDPQNLDRIFEPFFTTKPGGIGMGLSITQSIIEAHGGRIQAATSSPQGAVFEFTLPAAGGAS